MLSINFMCYVTELQTLKRNRDVDERNRNRDVIGRNLTYIRILIWFTDIQLIM